METESIQKRPIPYNELKTNFPFLENKINSEIGLDMEIAEVMMTATLPQVVGFQNIVRIKNSMINLGTDILEIHKDSLEVLYADAVSMTQASGAYVTAVKIWLGLKTDLKMILLFEPICIQKNNENDYIVYDSGKTYYYDENEHNVKLKFKSINVTDAGFLRKRYRDNIEIHHLNETVFRDFIRDQDTEAVIYPFQIIFTLLSDNMAANNCITLRNSIATNHQSGKLQNQHSLLLFTTRDVTIADKAMADFKDKYANRSHLCPPGCREIANLDLY